MSAFCLSARASGEVERERFSRAMAALDHHGVDARRSVGGGWFELGVQACWTTPEEEGEQQPLVSRDGRLTLAFCGRIDNRNELIAALDGQPSTLSDAKLALAGWERWDEGLLPRIVGPFALAVVDQHERTVTLARDPLGQRGMVFTRAGSCLVAATEEVALIAEGACGEDIDEGSFAQVFATDGLAPEATFFRDCARVPAGSLLRWRAGRPEVLRWWKASASVRRRRSDREAAVAVRETLEQAVSARLRARGRPAVMMSGGLDSTSIAGTMAQLAPRPLALSWMFSELREADERPWVEAMRDGCGLEHVEIAADHEWPLRRLDPAELPRNIPLDNAYRPLVHATYRAARARGATVLLNGEGADQLYVEGPRWLRDAVLEGRWGLACAGLVRELTSPRPADEQRRPTPRAALGLLRPRRSRPAAPPIWLTEHARGLWSAPPRPGSRDEAAWYRVTEGWDARASEWEQPLAARHGLEVRRPYRDLRLMELFFELSANQLYRPPWTKWVTRQALGGVVPDRVRWRRAATSLRPLLLRGVEEREREIVERLLRRPDALWCRYLARDWLMPGGELPAGAWSEGRRGYLAWLAVTCEIWRLGWSDPDRLAALAVGAGGRV